MVRAIARQAEAERERRAKIIHAEGELQASEKLLQAAKSSHRSRRRCSCVTWKRSDIGADKNTTIVFPVPLDILSGLGDKTGIGLMSSGGG